MSEYIQIEKKKNVYIMRLCRPEKLNALSYRNLDEINAAIEKFNSDSDCRVLILTGTGRAFSVGADVSPENTIGNLTGTAKVLASVQKYKYTNRLIEYARPFTIAAVNGYALGGGLEMALSCDIRVASESSQLGIPETRLGSFPGGGAIERLPRQIGLGRAKEMLATAEAVSGQRAYEIGLVEHVVPDGELLSYCVELGEKIAKNSTTAIYSGKRAMSLGLSMDMEKAMELDTAWMGVYAESHDRIEGRRAFAEKRTPEFE